MEKFRGLNEYDTTQLLLQIHQNDYDKELINAVHADNHIAVEYMISRVNDPFYYLNDLLTETKDVLVAEVLLKSVNYQPFRRLNACLSKVKSLEVLNYLVNHDVMRFNLGYKKSQCLRFAALCNDMERMTCFLTSGHRRNYDLTVRGMNTLNKNCVELAFMNGNDDMLKLFIRSGSNYFSIDMCDKLNERLIYLRSVICRDKMENRRKLFNLIIRDRSMKYSDLPIDVLEKAFPECISNVRLCRIKARRLVASAY